MYSRVNQRFLNTFLIFFPFQALFDSPQHEKAMVAAKIAVFRPFGAYKAQQASLPLLGLFFKVALSAPNCHLRCLDPLNTFSECKKNIFGPHMTYGDTQSNFEKLPQKWQRGLLRPLGSKRPKNSDFGGLHGFFVLWRVEKCLKCENNIRNVFRNL